MPHQKRRKPHPRSYTGKGFRVGVAGSSTDPKSKPTRRPSQAALRTARDKDAPLGDEILESRCSPWWLRT